MKKSSKLFFSVIIFCTTIFSTQLLSQTIERNDFSFTPPGALKFGLYGYDNPAVLTYLHQPDMYFAWKDVVGVNKGFNNWGLFTAIPNFGFTMISSGDKDFSVTEYNLSSGFGNPALSFGAGYGWFSGNVNQIGIRRKFTVGALFRPNNFVSAGLVGSLPSGRNKEGIVDLSIRPLGNEIITLFGDYIFTENEVKRRNNWSFGIVAEPIDGIRLSCRYFENKLLNIGTQISIGYVGLSSQSTLNNERKNIQNIYGVRLGAYDRSIIPKIISKDKYVKLDLTGGIRYQRYQFLDNSNTLIDLLKQIDAAKNDVTVNGIAISLSGLSAGRVMIWEIREKLKQFKQTGKKIIVYADRLNIDTYHLASIADKIVLDPIGNITLEGYVSGRTFYKGSLEKLGIGFNELRYFKYKSAAESYSREMMSEADREQRQRLVDEYYRIAKSDICQSRDFSSEEFEKFVNEFAIFSAQDAMRYRLVDSLGRWDTVNEIIKSFNKDKPKITNPLSLEEFNRPVDNYWGKKPAVAVIYAIGGTQLDEGIKARSLVKYIESAVSSNNIKAIVLRVDSPGGDALASDLIAEALKKAKGKKPVIVSQGSVAASGGYWLSMYADTIVAAPGTVTGSIGVIAMWVYNNEFKESLGMSTDYVKAGRFSDLTFGANIPILGLTLPDRNLSETEMKKAEAIIKNMYKDFVEKVASGRNRSYDEIDKIGEGRVWSGADGVNIGLVDVLGGLETAIDIAVERAGLKNKQYKIIELPERPLIDLSRFIPSFIPGFIKIDDDPFIMEMRSRILNNGLPMPVLPLDFISNDMSIKRF